MKCFKIIFILFFIFSLFSPVPYVLAEGIEYQTLAPIEGFVDETVTIDQDGTSFGKYLNDMYRLGIAIAGALAVLMIVIGGIQYVSSDAMGNKTEGKEKINAALLGLVVALGSYVMLRTISPDFLNTTFTVEPIETTPLTLDLMHYVSNGYTAGSSTDPSLGPGAPGYDPTGQFSSFPPGVNVLSKGKTIDQAMVPGLAGMQAELAAAGIQWGVTEGYPPSRAHKADCHRTGTCIDADFTAGGDNPANIAKFIQAANNNGFDAVWEVKTQAEKDRALAGGVPADRVKVLGNWISGSHFSVYNKKKR